jgi:hypothetical protein
VRIFLTETSFIQLSCNELGETSDGGLWAENNDGHRLHEIYYCTIIDILQPYNTFKSLEHSMKSLVYDNVCPPFNWEFCKSFIPELITSNSYTAATNICCATRTLHSKISKVYCNYDSVNNLLIININYSAKTLKSVSTEFPTKTK